MDWSAAAFLNQCHRTDDNIAKKKDINKMYLKAIYFLVIHSIAFDLLRFLQYLTETLISDD